MCIYSPDGRRFPPGLNILQQMRYGSIMNLAFFQLKENVLLSGFCYAIVYVVIPRFQFSMVKVKEEAAAGEE